MKINLYAPILTCICLVTLTSALSVAQPKNAGRKEDGPRTERARAKDIYNESLSQLFVDLEHAKTSEQLQLARSRATQGFKRALDQDSSYCLPYYNLGVLAEAEGDRIAAINYFEQFKKLSDKPELSLKAQKKLEYLRSLDTSDNSAAGRKKNEYEEALRKVNALINLGLLKEAISVAADAAQLEPARWESYALIGAALLDRKLFADALGFLQQARLRAPAAVRSKLEAAIKACEANIKR